MGISEVLSKIKKLQAALSAFSLLQMNSYLYSPDTTPCDRSAYDYVIVGGGIGGSVVAARLVEAGFCVLVLEAGGVSNLESLFPGVPFLTKHTGADWNYTAEPDGFTGDCHRSSGLLIPRVLGGAAAIDFMIYSRGNPSNYAKWSEATNDDSWEWENMMKYFKRSENLKDPAILNSEYRQYHGIGGKVNITRDPNDVCDVYLKGFELAGEPVPLDNAGNASSGYSRALFNIDNGVRNDAALSYLSPVKNNPKLKISFYSLVTKIVFDDHKNAVTVKFIKDGKEITVKAKKEVIVCAGSSKSPQVLMLSGIGPKKELDKWDIPCISDLPVGRNLRNLIGVYLAFRTKKKADPEPFNAHKFPSALVVGHSAIKKSDRYPTYETLNFIIDNINFFQILCGFTFAYENEICDRLDSLTNGSQILNTVLFNLDVESQGQVVLRSNDPKDSPKIILGYYTNYRDLQATTEQIQHFMKVVSTPYFKEIGLEFMEPTDKCNHLGKGTRAYWRCYALCMTAGTGRYVGTNSMGSVVDEKLCVKGVKKLRVVDASVIPYTVSGTISGSIVAVAEKGAEMIISAGKDS